MIANNGSLHRFTCCTFQRRPVLKAVRRIMTAFPVRSRLLQAHAAHLQSLCERSCNERFIVYIFLAARERALVARSTLMRQVHGKPDAEDADTVSVADMSLPTIPAFREFANHAVMDVMYYLTPR